MIRTKRLWSLPFLVLLLVSLALWLMGKLSHTYTTQVELPVVVRTDYEAQMWVDAESKTIRAVVSGDGRDLLLYKMGLAPELEVPLSMLTLTQADPKGDPYRYLVDEESLTKALGQVQDRLTVKMITDTLQSLRVSYVDTWRIPLRADVRVECVDGYMLDGQVHLSVDSLDVRAPWAVLDTLSALYTQPLVLKGVYGLVSGSVAVRLPKGASIKNKKTEVGYVARAVPYSEKVFEVPIRVEGFPEAVVLPPSAQVRLRVPMVRYGTVDRPMVWIKPTPKPSKSGYYPLVVEGLDEGAVLQRIEPTMGQYLIER